MAMSFPSRAGLWEDTKHKTLLGHPLGQRIASQEFGTGVRSPKTIYQTSSYYNHQQSSSSSGSGGITSSASKFRLCLDVRQFTSQELEVKTSQDFIIVHGKHEEKEDEFSLVAREFTRRYPLPNNVDPDTITSSLTTDGILLVEAPQKSPS